MLIETSAGAVLFIEKEKIFYYLLLRYKAGHWDFPKGNIEKGEEIKETVAREIREETGIRDIFFESGFKEQIEYFYRLKHRIIKKTVTFFLAKTKEKDVKLSFEHTDFQWLSYSEALEKLTFKNAKDVLKKANSFLSGVKI